MDDLVPFLSDPDFTLYVGDVRETLAGLPDGSVDCVITSPPYWGLRDYGTGEWDGGNPDCDHSHHVDYGKKNDTSAGAIRGGPMRDVCTKCGARRVDRQLGLEPTPDEYVQNMVAVFREVRRVLADHGTCWVNLGDSYAATLTSDRHFTQPTGPDGTPATKHPPQFGGQRTAVGGLKPKDLVGIPWRVAFALQADGWYLRADIVWAKPNPMPESVTDRPTKAHEYVFLLSKRPRYWFDQEAVREPHALVTLEDRRFGVSGTGRPRYDDNGDASAPSGFTGAHPAGRNVRSVWEIATQPYPEAHFATYPEELVRRCLLAGCPEWVCRVCGKPRERSDCGCGRVGDDGEVTRLLPDGAITSAVDGTEGETSPVRLCGTAVPATVIPGNYRPGVVLDPFMGSGTTALVARRHGRRSIGIELNPQYAELAARRLSQLSLLAEVNG